LSEDEVYKISMTSSPSTAHEYYVASIPSLLPKEQLSMLRPEEIQKVDVTNKEIEKQLKGLMLAFEKSSTDHYAVKKAKTTLTVTKTGEGKGDLTLGLGIIKLVDLQGKLVGEIKRGIEIEIERREDKE